MCRLLSVSRLFSVLMLLVALPHAQAADDTLFDYGTVTEDVSDVSFYSPSGDTAPYENAEPRVRSVIFLIGDGMGFGQVAYARVRTVGPEGRLYMKRMPVQGWASTHSANGLVTDSAASGTALACGVKTNNGTLVVVTADHATGGLGLKDDDGKAIAVWSTGGHTGNPVPVFAYGPGSVVFAGVQDNTEIPKKLAELLGVDRFPVPLEETPAWDTLADTIPPKSEPDS